MAMSDYDLSDLAAVTKGDDGFGGNGSGWWIILLFILLGGWGWGGNRNQGVGSAGGDILYPWMENQAAISNGFANVQAQSAAQASAMQAQLAQCCCDNRLATANLQATIASEECATRQTISDGIRDLLVSQNAGTQRVLDQMCQDKIDAKNDEIAQLRTQINILNLAASQNAQTAAIIANNEAQTTALERYLAPSPVPAYVVQNPNCCTQNFGCGCGM